MGLREGPVEGVVVGFREGPVEGEVVGFREGPVEGVVVIVGEGLEDGPVMMVTGYGGDVAFKSASSGRKLTVTTTPAEGKEEATLSLISIQRVEI